MNALHRFTLLLFAAMIAAVAYGLDTQQPADASIKASQGTPGILKDRG